VRPARLHRPAACPAPPGRPRPRPAPLPISANLAYAVFLCLLAGATAARKKIAWWLVVVYLGLLVLADALGVALGLYAESLP
jgi:hypothetical protein